MNQWLARCASAPVKAASVGSTPDRYGVKDRFSVLPNRRVQTGQCLSRLQVHSTQSDRCAPERSHVHLSIREGLTAGGVGTHGWCTILNSSKMYKLMIAATSNGRRNTKLRRKLFPKLGFKPATPRCRVQCFMHQTPPPDNGQCQQWHPTRHQKAWLSPFYTSGSLLRVPGEFLQPPSTLSLHFLTQRFDVHIAHCHQSVKAYV